MINLIKRVAIGSALIYFCYIGLASIPEPSKDVARGSFEVAGSTLKGIFSRLLDHDR
ncbi:hypothetical protein [Pseudomonas nitroreducens]|uniref:hypothetical protein n=1 Tax=Pseudomonas nitroreducens TaxID=46680 RepID=UPI0028B0A5A3|nr:hypothetical protein [Pseudomonas nitroreducens]